MGKFGSHSSNSKHISKKSTGLDKNPYGQLTPGSVTEDKLANNSVAEDKLESRVKARVLDIKPTDLRIGLDFEPLQKFDQTVGSGIWEPEETMQVAAGMIRQGAIMNVELVDQTSFSGRNFTGSTAKAVSADSKFGRYAALVVAPIGVSADLPGSNQGQGAFGGFGFPAHTRDPYTNTLTLWYKNVASGDSIAFNAAMGINIFIDSDGKLKVRVETLVPNGDNAKKIFIASTNSTDHIATTEYRNVIIKWQFNLGTSDFISIKINGNDDGTPITGETISIDCPNGGFWNFNCSPNDPIWDHELSMNVAPDTEGTWTRQLDGAPIIDLIGGDMNISIAKIPGQRVRWTNTTTPIDLNDFTLDYTLLVKDAGPQGALDAPKVFIDIYDQARSGPDTTGRSILIQHWRDTFSIFVGQRGVNMMHVYSQPLGAETKHLFRITSFNDPNDPSYGSPVTTVLIDGIGVIKFNNYLPNSSTADSVIFGTDQVATERNLSHTWGRLRYASGKLAGGNGGTITRKNTPGQLLDSVGLIEGNISDDVVALLQELPVTEIYRRKPTYLPYLRAMKRSQLGTNTTVASTTFDEPSSFGSADGSWLYGDGMTEYEIIWECDSLVDVPGRDFIPAITEVNSNYTVVGFQTLGPDHRWVTHNNHQANKRDKFITKRRMIVAAGDRMQLSPAIFESVGSAIHLVRDSWWWTEEIVSNKAGAEE